MILVVDFLGSINGSKRIFSAKLYFCCFFLCVQNKIIHNFVAITDKYYLPRKKKNHEFLWPNFKNLHMKYVRAKRIPTQYINFNNIKKSFDKKYTRDV